VSSVFDDVVVCIPTVASRASVLAETLEEWSRFGVEPLVQLQPDEWTVGHFHRRNSDRTFERALTEYPGAEFILFSEDDILLSPDLEVWIPALLGAPVTLFLDGWEHYPRQVRRRCRAGRVAPEGIVRVHRPGIWHGSLAILLPRRIAQASLDWSSDLQGWDIHFQAFILRHRIPLYAPVPNLVQHRGVPTTHRPDAGGESSATFGLPADGAGISPAAGVDWLALGGWDASPNQDVRRTRHGGL
jgi:hypothetical protein